MKNKFTLKTLILASIFMSPALSMGSEFHAITQNTQELGAEQFPVILDLLTNPDLIAAKANFSDTSEKEYANLNYLMGRSLDELAYTTQEPVRKSPVDQAFRQKKICYQDTS